MINPRILRMAALGLAGAMIVASSAPAQSGDTTTAGAATQSDGDKPPFKQEELDQMLAPLALYPDSLLSQVLMASTYPLEIVQADRWAKANKDLKSDALAKALEEQPWDASVKSLVNFPDVLAMLSDKLDWTVNVGDAFIGQQQQVMETVQTLRGKAKATGNLESNKEQTVTVQPSSSTTQTQVITIESASPEVVYVPAYNPTVVYGGWPYPSYPPYPYYPPGYALGTAAISFGVGVACGAAWGYAWGGCDWHHGDVNIDVNRNTNFNNNINRTNVQNNLQQRNTNIKNGQGTWQHDGSHRQGTPYRNQGEARQFGGSDAASAAKARDAYRGRAETGRQDIARGGADQFRGGQGRDPSSRAGGPGASGAGTRDVGGGGSRDVGGGAGSRDLGGGSRDGAAAGNRSRPDAGASNRASGGGNKGAMSGIDKGGGAARAQSSRGSASRSASSGSRGGSGGARSGGGGSGGGGSRGGGGGRR